MSTSTKENTNTLRGFFRRFFKRIFAIEEIGIVTSLIVISLFLMATTKEFGELTNIINVLRQASYFGMMAVGMVFVISQGDIDISVTGIYNLVSVIMAILLQLKFPFGVALIVALISGALMGALNGLISVILHLPMLIVSLGTSTIFHSLSLAISNATTISKFPKENWFFHTFNSKIFDLVPTSVIVMFVVGIIGYILYNHTVFGRHVCAIGANKVAASFSGINIDLNRVLTLSFNGFVAGVAGVTLLGFMGAADPSIGQGTEIIVIASAIIGGASLSGGSGSIIGALIAAIIMAVIRNGLVLLGVTYYWTGVVTGVAIIAAVALDYILKRRRA